MELIWAQSYLNELSLSLCMFAVRALGSEVSPLFLACVVTVVSAPKTLQDKPLKSWTPLSKKKDTDAETTFSYILCIILTIAIWCNVQF